MRTLSIAALIALSTTAALIHAQGSPQRRDSRQQIQQEVERLRAAQREARTNCTMPDGSSHPLNTVVSYEDETYRCVEVFTPTPPAQVPPGQDQTLTVRMAGWVKVS